MMTHASATPQLSKLETIIAVLDELVLLTDIEDMTRRIARGFVEIGAVMCVIFEQHNEQLRVAARWPEVAVDGLYAQVTGRRFADFAIPLSDERNPYVRVFVSQKAKLLTGPEQVADHLLATYYGKAEQKPLVMQRVNGKAGVVLPLVASGRSMGVAAINYTDDLHDADRHLFNVFAASAATVLNFRRDVISKETLLEELETALARERDARVELNRAERLAALGEMAAVVAHEIRNPLGIIANSIASLRRHVDGSDQAALLLGIVNEESGRINRIIDDMLSYSSPMEHKGQYAALDELIERAVELARRDAPHRDQLEVEQDDSGTLPPVFVNSHLITQALVNLLANAFDATQPGGCVTIRRTATERDGGRFVRIVITDDGVGISAADLAQLYKPFFTTKTTGTGLGLAIVKRIVDVHGGSLDIRSTLNQGTEVCLELPVDPPAKP